MLLAMLACAGDPPCGQASAGFSRLVEAGVLVVGHDATAPITIANDGCLDVDVDIALSDDGGAFGLEASEVPSELAPGETVAVPIRFAPSRAGWFVGTLEVRDGNHVETVFARGRALDRLVVQLEPRILIGDGVVNLHNCDEAVVEVGGMSEWGTGTAEIETSTSFPQYVLPGAIAEFEFTVPSDTDSVVELASNTPLPPVRVLSAPCTSTDSDADGISACDGDCDDDDPTVLPGAAEPENGIDDDCDGMIDYTGDCGVWSAALSASGDADRDGVGVSDGDCDDANGWARPDLAEMCDDWVDNDCDGELDEGC